MTCSSADGTWGVTERASGGQSLEDTVPRSRAGLCGQRQPPINTKESWPFPALGHSGEVALTAGPPTPLHSDRLCRPSVLDINI